MISAICSLPERPVFWSRTCILLGALVLAGAACGTRPPGATTVAATSTVGPEPTTRPTREPPVGTDISPALPAGDLARGTQLAKQLFCNDCHVVYAVAPAFASTKDMPAIAERGDLRIADPDYAGQATTAEEYLIESILLPEVYLVDGGSRDHQMGTYYDNRLNAQELADILAWLYNFR